MLSDLKLLVVPALLSCLLITGPDPTHAQDRGDQFPRVSPNATVSQTIGVTEVRLTYGRPSVRGRTIFGDLVPYGEIWRTGANEATTVSVSTPVQIEGKQLDAGTYSLFTIPGQDTWTLVLNEEANQWGAYNHDPDKDVLRVEVAPESGNRREQLIFTFEDVTDASATCLLHWAETSVPFEISVNTKEQVRARAEEAVPNAEDWQTPARYASYALEQEHMIEDALGWVDRSIELNERFANLALKARLLAANGQHGAAIETANTALDQAESMDESPDGVSELQSQIEDWTSKI